MGERICNEIVTMRHKGSQDARDPGRFWSRIDDWQSTPCRFILLSRIAGLFIPLQSPRYCRSPFLFPWGCIPPQRFLFHCRRFLSLRLSSATLVTECFLCREAAAQAVAVPGFLIRVRYTSCPRDYQRWKKDITCKRVRCHLIIGA